MDTTERSKTYIVKKNLSFNDVVSFNISYPFHDKWYSLFANCNTFYTVYGADFGEGKHIHLHALVLNLNINHSFDMGKGWTAQLSNYYTSPSIALGTFKIRAQWSMDEGLQKVLWKGKGKGIVGVSISDILILCGSRAPVLMRVSRLLIIAKKSPVSYALISYIGLATIKLKQCDHLKPGWKKKAGGHYNGFQVASPGNSKGTNNSFFIFLQQAQDDMNFLCLGMQWLQQQTKRSPQ